LFIEPEIEFGMNAKKQQRIVAHGR